MRISPSLPSLPGPLWPDVVELDKVLSMGPLELNYVLNWIAWKSAIFAY